MKHEGFLTGQELQSSYCPHISLTRGHRTCRNSKHSVLKYAHKRLLCYRPGDHSSSILAPLREDSVLLLLDEKGHLEATSTDGACFPIIREDFTHLAHPLPPLPLGVCRPEEGGRGGCNLFAKLHSNCQSQSRGQHSISVSPRLLGGGSSSQSPLTIGELWGGLVVLPWLCPGAPPSPSRPPLAGHPWQGRTRGHSRDTVLRPPALLD